jgi:hypothetical protein
MMKHQYNRQIACILVLALALPGCYKYKEAQPLSNPAYLRVFNSIPYDVSALNAQAAPFLCFLLDPVFDAGGTPVGGTIVGDWLQVRELYSMSYPLDAGTALNAGNGQYTNNPGNPTISYVTNANYEYPGKLHVATAPPMNGLDLSAWAQVPSGKHRLMFVSRPQNNTDFGQLAPTLRNKILIDTTVTLTAGDVYTLDALEKNLDSNSYGAYLRNEQFVHQQFDPGRLYTAFYNLSGTPSFLTTNSNYPDYYFLSDTLAIYYTYNIFDDNFNDSPPGSGYSPPVRPLSNANHVYLGTVVRGRDDLSTFTSMPFLSRNYFFNEQGVLRSFFGAQSGDSTGTMPYVSFTLARTAYAQYGYPYPELDCSEDPAVFNTLNPDNVNYFNGNPAASNQPQPFGYQVSLFQVVQSDTSLNFYPTINIFEMIYDRIYMMQLERQFEKVPD